MFKLFFTIGALFSVGMLTISGVRYMLSDVVTDKEKAKNRIKACLWGLLLLAAAWLILYTINPQLLQFTLIPPCPTTGCTVLTGSGNTSLSGTAGGNTSQPSSVTVNLSDSYSAQSSFAQQVAAAQGSGFILRDAGGAAVVVVNNNNINNSNFISTLNNFTQKCEAGGQGSVRNASANNQTLYLCQQN
jgi:hypothetical protein